MIPLYVISSFGGVTDKIKSSEAVYLIYTIKVVISTKQVRL